MAPRRKLRVEGGDDELGHDPHERGRRIEQPEVPGMARVDHPVGQERDHPVDHHACVRRRLHADGVELAADGVAVSADSDRQTSDPRRVVHDEAGDVLEDPALLLGAGLQDAHRLITPRCGPSSALRPPPSAGDDCAARIRPPGPETYRSTPQHPPRPSIGLSIRDVPSMRSRGPKARAHIHAARSFDS